MPGPPRRTPTWSAPYLMDDSDPLLRVKAAEVLIRRNPTHAESRLLLARVAIAAGLTGRARGALEALVQSGAADRRAYLLLAELEEAEHGETPEARAAQGRWLREAAGAAPEPRWRCGNCGTEHAAWAPVCTACDTVGRIAWAAEPRAAAPEAEAYGDGSAGRLIAATMGGCRGRRARLSSPHRAADLAQG